MYSIGACEPWSPPAVLCSLDHSQTLHRHCCTPHPSSSPCSSLFLLILIFLQMLDSSFILPFFYPHTLLTLESLLSSLPFCFSLFLLGTFMAWPFLGPSSILVPQSGVVSWPVGGVDLVARCHLPVISCPVAFPAAPWENTLAITKLPGNMGSMGNIGEKSGSM